VEDVDLLDDETIEARLSELDGWERQGDTITKTFKRGDFVGAVEFVRKLVDPAEDMGHHPDLSVSWDEVRISITSHAAGGLTESDFELAKRIDALG
jgi:4a-hydroxytetrahydrobiopterin dehydratase